MILTHCNTGSLACSGFGTALGVVRQLHRTGKLRMAYCTETRPYNQVCSLGFWMRIKFTNPRPRRFGVQGVPSCQRLVLVE